MFDVKTFSICIVAVVICLPLLGGKKSYKGYRVVRVDLGSGKDWDTAAKFLNNPKLKLELWSVPTSAHDTLDLQVAPNHYRRLIKELRKHNLTHGIFIDDIQALVEDEAASMTYDLLKDTSLSHVVRRAVPSKLSNQVVGRYANLSEIEDWMESLAQNYPEVVKLLAIGKTYEGRDIYVLKVGRPRAGGTPKPALYMDGGIHAREWISPATVIYIIYQLIMGHDQGHKDESPFMDGLDWYFVPVANPDGYHHSQAVERLWRKNRSPNGNFTCKGTDLNRNWPYHWGKVTPYTSDNPCSIVYQGPSAGSELETKALMKFLLDHNDTIHAFISHHSYTQKWFTRWGYTNSTPPDHQQMMDVAKKAVVALEREGGESYDVGRPFELLYPYTGGSADWAKGIAKIKYSYTVELRDKGKYGFLLPANYVMPVGEELWAAAKVVASQLINETIENTTTTSTTTEQFDPYSTTTTLPTTLVTMQTSTSLETSTLLDETSLSPKMPSSTTTTTTTEKGPPSREPTVRTSAAPTMHHLSYISNAAIWLIWCLMLYRLWGQTRWNR